MAEQTTLSNLGEALGGVAAKAQAARRSRQAQARRSRAAPMQPGAARTPSRAYGSSAAAARSPSTARRSASISPARCCRCSSSSRWFWRCAATRSMSIAPSPAVGCRGRLAPCVTVLSRALTYFEPELRPVLKKNGFLTRDPRAVERKKYGRAKARRSFQFSKR